MARLWILIWALQIATTAASTQAVRLPLPLPTGNYTEEVWLYYREAVPDESFSVLYSPYRSEVQISRSAVQLSTSTVTAGTYVQGPVAADTTEPKLRRWIHIATKFYIVGTLVKCSLAVNGLEYVCGADITRSLFKVSIRPVLAGCRWFQRSTICSASAPAGSNGGTTFTSGTTDCGTGL